MNGGDLGRGAATALDGAVHVTLKLDAGVLAGEEQPSERTREPGAQRRIECRIEKRVAAAREGILFPHDLARADERGALRPEPFERLGQAGWTLPRDDRLRRVARAAAREQAEDTGPAALLLVAVPQGAERERRSKRARTTWNSPEPFRELQERLRRAAVLQAGDRIVLLGRQRGRDRNSPQQRRGKR